MQHVKRFKYYTLSETQPSAAQRSAAQRPPQVAAKETSLQVQLPVQLSATQLN
jgi:hypothetical protein